MSSCVPNVSRNSFAADVAREKDAGIDYLAGLESVAEVRKIGKHGEVDGDVRCAVELEVEGECVTTERRVLDEAGREWRAVDDVEELLHASEKAGECVHVQRGAQRHRQKRRVGQDVEIIVVAVTPAEKRAKKKYRHRTSHQRGRHQGSPLAFQSCHHFKVLLIVAQ